MIPARTGPRGWDAGAFGPADIGAIPDRGDASADDLDAQQHETHEAPMWDRDVRQGRRVQSHHDDRSDRGDRSDRSDRNDYPFRAARAARSPHAHAHARGRPADRRADVDDASASASAPMANPSIAAQQAREAAVRAQLRNEFAHAAIERAVRALIDDPLTPVTVRERLARLTPADRDQIQRLTSDLVEGFLPVAAAAEWTEHAYRVEVTPALTRAAALMVAVGIGHTDLVAARLAFRHALDKACFNHVANSLQYAAGQIMPSLYIWLVRLLDGALRMSGGNYSTGPAGNPFFNRAAWPTACAGAMVWSESAREDMLDGRLLGPRPQFVHALARELAARFRLDASTQRDQRCNRLWMLQMIAHVFMIPAAVRVAGGVPGMFHASQEMMADLASRTAMAYLDDKQCPRDLPALMPYSFLALSQRDLAQRIESLANTGPAQWSETTMARRLLRMTLSFARPSSVLEGLVALAGLSLQGLLLDLRSPPFGQAPLASSTGIDGHADTDHGRWPLDHPGLNQQVSARDSLWFGLMHVTLSTLTSYALLTARAHAPAVNAVVDRWLERLGQWWRADAETRPADLAVSRAPRAPSPSSSSSPANPRGRPPRTAYVPGLHRRSAPDRRAP